MLIKPHPSAPAEFGKVVFRVNDARVIKKCKNSVEVSSVIRSLFKLLEINKYVFAWSKIGNSLIEVVVPKEEIDEVKFKIRDCNMMIIENPKLWLAPPHHEGPFPPDKFIKRVAFMYKNARLNKIRECLLSDVPNDIANQIQMLARETKPSEALATETALIGNGNAMDVSESS